MASNTLRTLASNPGLGNFSDTICQTLKELVDNSVDSQADRIRIILKQENNRVDLNISDNGRGIDDIQKAVDPFNSNKVDDTSGRYGIGLTRKFN